MHSAAAHINHTLGSQDLSDHVSKSGELASLSPALRLAPGSGTVTELRMGACVFVRFGTDFTVTLCGV